MSCGRSVREPASRRVACSALRASACSARLRARRPPARRRLPRRAAASAALGRLVAGTVMSSPRASRSASSALRATVTVTVTSTSGCSDTGTLYMPIILIGMLSAIWRALDREAASR